jgi:hypothetical protein
VLLDRHQERREAGLPTLSVLSGAAGRSVQLGRQWAEQRGRELVVIAGDDSRPKAIVDAWVDALAARRDLFQDALGWLCRRLDRLADELGPAFGRQTPFERNAFLGASLPEETDVAAVCRWLLGQSPEAVRPPGLGARLGAVLASGERVVSALFTLVPEGRAPGLLLVQPVAAQDLTAWIAAAAACLARLAEAEPRLLLLAAIESEALDRFHAQACESRARALIRGGTVHIVRLDGPEIGRRLERAIPGAARTFAGPIRRLAADGASDRLVDLFLDAARATAAAAPHPQSEHDDRARSAAERFLFERLETLPQTAGLFTLNARLDFAFGAGRAMEVDLAAPGLALAVEIDGYYHFQNADAYRRDRRKDFELQRQGFLVVRVLADDVVRRLEDVLDHVLAAVASRRSHHSEGASS